MKYLFISLSYVFILSGCSPAESAGETTENNLSSSIEKSETGIHDDFDVSFNINEPESVIAAFKDEFGINSEAELSQDEFVDKIYDTYSLDEDYIFVLNDDGSLRFINVRGLSEDKVQQVFELIDFPFSSGFEILIDEYDETEKATSTFTEYKGVGLSLKGYSDFSIELFGYTEPYTMQIIYDQEHIENRRDLEKERSNE